MVHSLVVCHGWCLLVVFVGRWEHTLREEVLVLGNHFFVHVMKRLVHELPLWLLDVMSHRGDWLNIFLWSAGNFGQLLSKVVVFCLDLLHIRAKIGQGVLILSSVELLSELFALTLFLVADWCH